MMKNSGTVCLYLFLVTVTCCTSCAPGLYSKTNGPDSVVQKSADNSAGLMKGMVFVKGGCFDMGDIFGEGRNIERPAHEVCVNDFYIGKYEVTQAEWRSVIGKNPSNFRECGDTCPVENVSWVDTQEFIGKLNERTGGRYRLPTEAEWEYAARSGEKKEEFSGTSSLENLNDFAWHSDNSDNKTHPAGQKKPNGLGLYDMSGNVWEWVNDWFDSSYYAKSPRDNPMGPDAGEYKVLRGGSWNTTPTYLRTTFRNFYRPQLHYYHFGLRLVLPAR